MLSCLKAPTVNEIDEDHVTSVNSLLCRQAASRRQSAAHRHTLTFCLFLLKVLTFEDSIVFFLLSASSVWIFVVAFLFFSYKKDLKYKEIQKGWLTYPAVYSLWKPRSQKVS